MSSGVILQVNKDKSVPDELIDKLTAKFTQTVGVAVVEGGELKVLHSDEGADNSILKVILKDYMDSELFIYLGDRKPTELEMQPFVLLKGADGKPLLVAFLCGDFNKNIPKGGTSTGEWYAVEADLRSRIQDTFDLCGSDISKTMERLKTHARLEKDLRNLYGDVGTITLIAKTGEHHTIETGTKTLDAEWGWVTDPLDYNGGGQTQTTTASPKPFTLQNFRRAAAAIISPDKPAAAPPAAKPSAPPAAAPPKSPPAAAPPAAAPQAKAAPPAAKPAAPPAAAPQAAPPKTPAAPPAAAPPKVVEQDGQVLIPKVELTDVEKFVQCPTDITNNAGRQAYYRREAGWLPDNYKDCPRVEISKRKQREKLRVKAQKAGKSFVDAFNGGVKSATTATSVPTLPAKPPMAATGKESEYPDTSTKNIPEEIEVGILSAAQKKGLNDFISDGKVIKMIDKHSKLVTDPAALQAWEERRPSFTDITGLDMDEMHQWPPQALKMMAEHDPAWAERLMSQAIYERHCMKNLLNKKQAAEEAIPAPAKPAASPAAKPPPAATPKAPTAAPPAARRQVA